MKNRNEDWVWSDRKNLDGLLNVLGIILILWGLAAVIYQINIQEAYFVLWFCYLGLIMTGIGIILRNDFIIAAQVAIFGIPLIIWSADFFSFLFTENFIWGITEYFFEDQTKTGNLISIQHIFTLPVALFSLWMIKLKRKDFWVLSLFEVVVLYIVSRIFSTPEHNINCVFSSCFPADTPLPYAFDWFFFAFLMIFISSAVMVNLKFLRGRFK